jgi:hypothetical protein
VPKPVLESRRLGYVVHVAHDSPDTRLVEEVGGGDSQPAPEAVGVSKADIPGKSKNGTRYFYYLCRGKQDRTRTLPYLPVEKCERAVENHYTRISLPAELRDRITAAMHAAMSEDGDATTTLRTQIDKQLAALDIREDHYLDLVGNPDWPTDKLSAKMREVRAEGGQLTARLDDTRRPDLSGGLAIITHILDLLTDPHGMYVQAGEASKRVLNE